MITRKVVLIILLIILIIHLTNRLYFIEYMSDDKIKNYINRLKIDIVA